MRIGTICFTVFCLFVAIIVLGQEHQDHRVVFELGKADETSAQTLITMANNLISDSRMSRLDIRVVAHGAGVGFLLPERHAQLAQQFSNLIGRGAKVYVCNNTFRSMAAGGVTKAQLIPAIEFTESGIGELVLLHTAGFAYIAP